MRHSNVSVLVILALASSGQFKLSRAGDREMVLARQALYCAQLGAKVLQLSSLPKEESLARQTRGLQSARILAAKVMSEQMLDVEMSEAKDKVLSDFRNKVRENEMFPGLLDKFVRESSASCTVGRNELKSLLSSQAPTPHFAASGASEQ
jgi:predicted glycoside hydrolase/deacetylase ChbG (UPF0249 family)